MKSSRLSINYLFMLSREFIWPISNDGSKFTHSINNQSSSATNGDFALKQQRVPLRHKLLEYLQTPTDYNDKFQAIPETFLQYDTEDGM